MHEIVTGAPGGILTCISTLRRRALCALSYGSVIMSESMMPETRSIASALAERFVDYKDKIDDISAQLKRYKQIVDLCPLPTFLCDAEGRWVYANPCLLQLTHMTLVDVQYDGWQNIIDPAERAESVEAWNKYVLTKSPSLFVREFKCRRPDGNFFSTFIQARALDDGSIVGFAMPGECKTCLRMPVIT